jgi:signal transduction histidine kinase
MTEHDSDAISSEQDAAPETAQWIIPDASRMEALAEFAAGAGHEINNPLATIIGRAQQLLKDEPNPQRRQMLLSIGAQAYRVRDMIGDTMLFGRPPAPELQRVSLAEVAAKVVSQFGEQLAQSNCKVVITVPPTLVLNADPVQLAVALSELLRNSRHALQPSGGEIELTATETSDGFVQLEITDRGAGFSELERIHAFDPFFSGRQAGRGLGFGLSKCWQILRQHGGRIEIESATGGPTTVRSFWPISK